MSVLRCGDVVKNSNYPFNFKVLKVTKQWATCEGMNEHGQRVVEDFSPEFLEVVSRRPGMNINFADVMQAYSK
ncbi:hypothetical protein AOR11_24450 [Vibrio alginolyticus]|uniref:hypothetical protein n=1 Tax=Vibrio alginolyticus TaxID=663 RepID=UPI0006CA763E|nr:hypothetical protein [Vibrio alginolyticus]KPM95453.1 hypothetical protein AOR11_24450 [Vibrio alginolyticus]